MKRPMLENRRNIGIISHIDAGKTTTTERILYYSGFVHRLGEVDQGSATTDWMSQERERGISISAAAITTSWRDHEITIIDTPGHVDFTIEVERSLRVLDGAVAIFSAVEGVEPQSETVWRQADKFGVPRIVFINKLDRMGADFGRTVEMIQERLGTRPIIMQWPDVCEGMYVGQVDVLSGEYLTWSDTNAGREVQRSSLEGVLADKAGELREALAEAGADYDEGIAEVFLEGGIVEAPALKKALRRGVLAGEIVPVYCGASLRNQGIQPLIEGVIDYLPSPMDIPAASGHLPGAGVGAGGSPIERPPDESAPFSALVFKVQIDGGRRLTFLRVYSGHAKVGEEVFNAGQDKVERLARIFRMYSHKRERIEEVGPGDIVVAAGMKSAATGDTLSKAEDPIVYESILAPTPVISSAIEPRSAAGSKKLRETLVKLEAEDPTFHVRLDADSGQTLISGMGELHLDVLTRRIVQEFGVEVRIGEPRVVYRETLLREADADAVFERELAGRPQYAKIRIHVAPFPGEGVICESLVSVGEESGEVPSELLQAALRTLEASSRSGILAGYEMTDVRVQIVEAGYDPERGTEGAFGIAAGNAFVAACRKAGGQLLEPMMAVEVVVPEEFMGAVINDCNMRGGRVGSVKEQPGSILCRIVRADTPLSKMFGYSTALRSLTQGRAIYTMNFSHYAKCKMAEV